MIIEAAQRWRNGRASYRPARECIDTSKHEVALIPDDRTAKAFVVAHHYSHKFPAARLRAGLYAGGELVGVAVFSHPMQDRVLDVLPCPRAAAVELGRFVLLDSVAANGESWFLARAFELIRREGICGVVSFADPEPRTDVAGHVVKPGHLGTIYRASNATFAGRAAKKTLRLLPDGTVLCDRTRAKIRRRERNWQSASLDLVRFGAKPLGEREDAAAWLATWVTRLTRTMRHGGNLRYLFGLERATKRHLPASLPYPVINLREAA